MKATGVVRKIDSLGRIVLPKELRKTLDVQENRTSMEIFIQGEDVILRKHEPACVFCGEARNVINYKGKNICGCCLKELRR
ncbi:AbrB/MazE/SpoVT family DNA-binding domain-containing protein [Clostridium botulinum]|uniref:AbrB/MazE/SpoVT family DNA-binding domain-containing protein n=1 Tax=Clostridium botulinum TaxID=1491 RepID=UPI00069C919B|nr:AbrB/MazE/SpoVT family DNA-binding domain-containing protein [Clostridium botulinum]KOA94258.1 AbrB family transcriptional regulator [Clostridium botulinum]MCD3204031.1 AbrB family transcriptional regulator [Clostridium botulinum C/D]MCD3222283.1 AbrB family transcriptional regulator [Clostridium botulinum C/D]MCD3232078.1 AbrB family transcriptional regulator [Clostridium botulinum C/D]MCD3273056.1 AbrB family transcriptional regulator [Clostridium botulinum C/D]